MSNEVIDELRQQEAGTVALSVKYNRWSQVMIEVLIQEQEQKLVTSDLPVEGEDDFWEEVA
jgi:hypothetical protein